MPLSKFLNCWINRFRSAYDFVSRFIINNVDAFIYTDGFGAKMWVLLDGMDIQVGPEYPNVPHVPLRTDVPTWQPVLNSVSRYLCLECQDLAELPIPCDPHHGKRIEVHPMFTDAQIRYIIKRHTARVPRFTRAAGLYHAYNSWRSGMRPLSYWPWRAYFAVMPPKVHAAIALAWGVVKFTYAYRVNALKAYARYAMDDPRVEEAFLADLVNSMSGTLLGTLAIFIGITLGACGAPWFGISFMSAAHVILSMGKTAHGHVMTQHMIKEAIKSFPVRM